MASYTLEECGGAMPTQAEGRTAGDRPFYFRARHGSWFLVVGEVGWPTDLLQWPGGSFGNADMVAQGSDETYGCMEQAAVEAILEQHLVGW